MCTLMKLCVRLWTDHLHIRWTPPVSGSSSSSFVLYFISKRFMLDITNELSRAKD